MMDVLFWLINAATVFVMYMLWIRPILKKTPKFSELYAQEGKFFSAFSGTFAGIKQRLTAAVIYLAGIIVPMHDYVAPKITGLDVTPLFPKIMNAVPPAAWPVIMVGVTMLMDYFRYLNDNRSQQ